MAAKKRVRTSPAVKQLRLANERIARLEGIYRHWYQPAISITDPCKACGLPILDDIHRDNLIGAKSSV